VGPNYRQPDLADITPGAWRGTTLAADRPQATTSWWEVFDEDELNRLEAQALAANPTLQAAAARVQQARAVARLARVELAPDVRAGAAFSRERTSDNPPTPVPFPVPSTHVNSFNAMLDLSYELDFWGKVRRRLEGAAARAEASGANYQTALLTLTGDVAANYFLLRAADAELLALRQTVELRRQTLEFLREKLAAGLETELGVALAERQLAGAQSQLAEAHRLRQEASDTLAMLCGVAATDFTLAERPLPRREPPTVPAGIPADVLRRRPDVAAAERALAARSAAIGAAQADYFPAVRLTAAGGFLSDEADLLLSAPSRVWSFAPSVSWPLTGLAAVKHNVRLQRAAYDEAAANFRQAVLNAIRDVETTLAQIRYLGEQQTAAQTAWRAAEQAAALSREAYHAGTLSHLDLLEAERARLLAEVQTTRLNAQRHLASIRLIKALGGAW
jgi:multidrug efflux system outer membrane protein